MTKVPILKEFHFGKMKHWRVEHLHNIFVFTFGPKSEDKYAVKVFNSSEFHFFEVTLKNDKNSIMIKDKNWMILKFSPWWPRNWPLNLSSLKGCPVDFILNYIFKISGFHWWAIECLILKTFIFQICYLLTVDKSNANWLYHFGKTSEEWQKSHGS